MKLSESNEVHHSGIRQSETPRVEPHVSVKPYILRDFVYLLDDRHAPVSFPNSRTRKIDLELPVGTPVTIHWNREFPGKVWLVAKIPIQTPQGIAIEPLARLIPETDLEHFEVSHLAH